MEPKRRLSAVWFADIVGYTTLSRTDEPAALRLVGVLQGLAREIVEAHDGRLVKFIGDAVLAEFSSTDAAVRAAVALQERYVGAAAEQGQPSQLRIGVHLGEVTPTADGDLYGDGINTAARLHQEAVPGQVIISEDVWRQLRQRPEFRFASLGAVELRGITTRVEIYDVLFGARAALGAKAAPAGAPSARAGAGRLWIGAAAVVAVALAGVAAAMLLVNGRDEPAAPAQAQPSIPSPSSPSPLTAARQEASPAPPVTKQDPSQTAPAQTQAAPKQTAPAPSASAALPPGSQSPAPSGRAAGSALPPRDADRVREMIAVRQLLEQFAAALSGTQPREDVAALGPGATGMSVRGVQELQRMFGAGLQARVGRIEPMDIRDGALEISFLLLARSTSRPQQTPLAFRAVITRGAGGTHFTSLRREAPGGRGRRGAG